ncbi:MAG: RNA polymerase factor sigma-54 [Bacteroidota bacterium]
MLRQNLSQKLQQKLSPQQIQLMKLLQIPSVNLEQRIKEELEVNPALEEAEQKAEIQEEAADNQEENYELEEYIQDYIDDDPYSYKLRLDRSSEEEDRSIPIAVEASFHDYLEDQLYLLNLQDEQKEAIALQIIGSIDDDGYLRRPIVSIRDDLMFAQNIFVEEKEIEELLQKIQQFEPAGVGARNLRESLLLQLRNKLESDRLTHFEHVEAMALAEEIIDRYFDEFSKKHYQKLQEELRISEDQLKAAIDEIIQLNPKPTSGFSSGRASTQQYITPDFTVENYNGELRLSLNNRNVPDLRVNNTYKNMLQDYSRSKSRSKQEQETVQFVKQKIDSARWFIDAIRQRYQTMYKTMLAILEYQQDYFLTGDDRNLRPMILKDIAEITNLDISTISRVVNSKFVQTEFGVKSLKTFFSESMQTDSGEEVSTIEIKRELEDIIKEESKRKPLSDDKLAKLLKTKGYNIARRTVAKYREQLNIPVARLRKEL